MGEFILRSDIPNVYKKMKAMGINDLQDIFGEWEGIVNEFYWWWILY